MRLFRSVVSRAICLVVIAASLIVVIGCNPGLTDPSDKPAITSVEPSVVIQGDRSRAMRINGQNLRSGGRLTISGSGVVLNGIPPNPAGTIIVLDVTVAAEAAPGPRTLTWTDGAQTTTAQIEVQAAAPQIDSIAPSAFAQDATQIATITGAFFAADATYRINAGTDIAVDQITVASSRSLTARFTVSATAGPIGTRSITVEINGRTAGLLQIALVPAGPVITSVSPAAPNAGRTYLVVIDGRRFVTGATSLTINDSLVSFRDVVALTTTKVQALMAIDAADQPGPRTLTLTTPGGRTTFPIQIIALRPSIGTFTGRPAIITPGAAATLAWSGIANATTCSINPGVGPVSCANGTAIVRPSATTEYQLLVTGPGGQDWEYATVNVEGGTVPSNASAGGVSFQLPAMSRKFW